MSFFDEIPPPEPEIEVDRTRPPEWVGPPENVVGVTVPVDRVLANTGDIALAIGGMTAYPTGVTFKIAMLRRELQDGDGDELFRMFHMPREGGLRFGIELPDGRRLAAGRRTGAEDDAPRLTPRGGRGVHDLDAAPIRAAAARAVELWPDERPVGDEW